MGVEVVPLAQKLYEKGAASFVASWNEFTGVIASKGVSSAAQPNSGSRIIRSSVARARPPVVYSHHERERWGLAP
jgi:hypothetical protein